MNKDNIQEIVDNNEGSLIAILEEIQSKYGYLPEKVLRKTSALTGRSMVDIYGIATFYKSFSLKPRGEHYISVCKGTACHVRGAPMIIEEFERKLGIEDGETSSDMKFTLETVNCLGACALGPIVVSDGHYFSNVKTSKVKNIIKKTKSGLDKVEIKSDNLVFPTEVRCPHCNHSWMDSEVLIDEFPSIRVTVSFNGQHGWLRLSSLYGSYTTLWEHKAPFEMIINFFCPFCHAEIISDTNCIDCGAPMVPMIIKKNGIVRICSRYGCKNHMLDLNSVNQ